jgi:hypothetical protein
VVSVFYRAGNLNTGGKFLFDKIFGDFLRLLLGFGHCGYLNVGFHISPSPNLSPQGRGIYVTHPAYAEYTLHMLARRMPGVFFKVVCIRTS